MNKKNWIAAAAAACMLLPVSFHAASQTPVHVPSAEDARQARENARRDAQMADAMEKARLREEAKPASVYIPKPQPDERMPVMKSPEVFSAKIPGSARKAPKKEPKASSKPEPKKKQQA